MTVLGVRPYDDHMTAELAHQKQGHSRAKALAIWGGAVAALIGLCLMLPVALIALLTGWNGGQFELSTATVSKRRLPGGHSESPSQ